MNACTILNDTLAGDILENGDGTKCLNIDSDILYELEQTS